MIICSRPECQTTAGCKCGMIFSHPAPNAAAPGVPANLRTFTLTAGMVPNVEAALRLYTALRELVDDPRVSPELIGLRVINEMRR